MNKKNHGRRINAKRKVNVPIVKGKHNQGEKNERGEEVPGCAEEAGKTTLITRDESHRGKDSETVCLVLKGRIGAKFHKERGIPRCSQISQIGGQKGCTSEKRKRRRNGIISKTGIGEKTSEQWRGNRECRAHDPAWKAGGERKPTNWITPVSTFILGGKSEGINGV